MLSENGILVLKRDKMKVEKIQAVQENKLLILLDCQGLLKYKTKLIEGYTHTLNSEGCGFECESLIL